jgi:ribosomal-protein-serine acetyltransferase
MERTIALAADNLNIQLDGNTELDLVRIVDAEELFAVIDRNRVHLHRWLPWAVPSYSIESARQFVAESSAKFAERESLAMTIRHRGALCGAIGLHSIDHLNKSTSIGYWLDAGHEGKGIITAACRAIVTEGFRTFGLHRIEIRCATWNHRSSAIPRRLEFVEEGILRDAEWLHDRWVDLRVFSMLAQDWKA